MSNLGKKFPGFALTIKCASMGGVIMFICMAAGELFVDPEMFHGFLNQPEIWPFIFLESAVWLIPFMLVILPLLKRLSTVAPKSAMTIVIASWITIGLAVAAIYNFTYYAGDWSVSQLARADIIFGWTLPYLIILAAFVYFSSDYLRQVSETAN